MSETTKAVVERYFQAWSTNDANAAYEELAPDLAFAGPSASYRTREEFRPGLFGFAALTRAARVVELVVEGDRAALLYDCDFVGAGTTRIASFFRVTNGKIVWYETFFDPTEFRKAMAARAG
jgi:ketosteroid isomerase-like protein